MDEVDVNVEAADEVGNTDTAVDEAEDQPEPVVKFTSAAPLLKLLQEKDFRKFREIVGAGDEEVDDLKRIVDLGGSDYILWFYTTDNEI